MDVSKMKQGEPSPRGIGDNNRGSHPKQVDEGTRAKPPETPGTTVPFNINDKASHY